MRELRLAEELSTRGISRKEIRWALHTGRWTLIIRGVCGRGPEPPFKLDVARATALVARGIAAGLVSGELHGFDGVKAGAPEVLVPRTSSGRRSGLRRTVQLPSGTVVIGQVRCLTAADTLLELAGRLADDGWEQALEFCLRKRLVTRDQLMVWQQGNTVSARRIRRVVLARGGLDVPPTESLLETLAVQLIRRHPAIPIPTRQFAIYDENGNFVGRPDLSWPQLGIFLELDGQQHDFQPVYDANRQTRITIKTGWRCGRFTWDQISYYPQATLRDIAALVQPLRSDATSTTKVF